MEQELNNVIKGFFRKEKNPLITFEDADKIPIDVPQLIYNPSGKLLKATKIKTIDGTIMFQVFMEKGSFYDIHYHDCKEICVVFKGIVEETISRRRSRTLESMTFKPYESHILKAIEDSIIYIELKK